VGRRFDDAANLKPLGAYTTLDLYADWHVLPEVTLQARLNNVADKGYETASGYNQPGRAAFLTVRWEPK
jgi:vitamin B12 transporter